MSSAENNDFQISVEEKSADNSVTESAVKSTPSINDIELIANLLSHPLFMTNTSASEATTPTKIPQRKKKQKAKTEAVKAESIAGFRGSQSVDELLEYINGASVSNDKKPPMKKSNQSSK